MNSIQEVMEALIRGEKIRKADWHSSEYIYMKEGVLYNKNNYKNDYWALNYLGSFLNNYESVEVYKEPQWYDNIPEQGVLCRVWNSKASENHIRIVEEKDIDDLYCTGLGRWANAVPLTREEVEQYIYEV